MHRATWWALQVPCPPHAMRWYLKSIMRNVLFNWHYELSCAAQNNRLRYFMEMIAVVLWIVWNTQTRCDAQRTNILNQVVYIVVIILWSGKRRVLKHVNSSKTTDWQESSTILKWIFKNRRVWSVERTVFRPRVKFVDLIWITRREPDIRGAGNGTVWAREKYCTREKQEREFCDYPSAVTNLYQRALLSAYLK
jgi:hypothetical protein